MRRKINKAKATQFFYNCQIVNPDFTGFESKAFLVRDGQFLAIGSKKQIQAIIKEQNLKKTTQEIDLKKQNVLPAFIECHTHTLFAGSRAEEFELRNNGMSYLEIAKRGGGILSTMKNTRQTSASQLLSETKKKIDRFMQQGVSTIEIKSGYALDLKNEIKSLQVINKIKSLYTPEIAPEIIPTFLGAHAKPPEFESYSEYLDYLASQVLPVVKKKKLAQRVDIFIEKNFFESKNAEQYLKQAVQLGFTTTIHANQLSLSGGAELALQLKSMSADHVIHLSDETIQSFGRSRTIPVLLPAADLYMKCPYPNARALIDAGARVALATDYNPGSCPTQDLALVGLLARLEMKMTLPEVFKAYTLHAATALGIDSLEGSIEPTKRANFISTYADMSDFFYSAGHMPKHDLFIRGNRFL